MATTRYDYDVFINCPFDPGTARCSTRWCRGPRLRLQGAVHLEVDDSGAVRIENI